MQISSWRFASIGLALALSAGCGGGGGGGGTNQDQTLVLPLDLAFSGTMVSFGPFSDASTGGFMLAGDEYYAGDDYEDRCFLSFDLGAVPAGAQIVLAEVQLAGRVYTTTNPYLVLGSLVADHVDLGTGITGNDFTDSLSTDIAVLPAFPAGLTYAPGTFPITGQVTSDLGSSRPRASFRLHFTSAPYHDGLDERVAIEASVLDPSARPTLVITYH